MVRVLYGFNLQKSLFNCIFFMILSNLCSLYLRLFGFTHTNSYRQFLYLPVPWLFSFFVCILLIAKMSLNYCISKKNRKFRWYKQNFKIPSVSRVNVVEQVSSEMTPLGRWNNHYETFIFELSVWTVHEYVLCTFIVCYWYL